MFFLASHTLLLFFIMTSQIKHWKHNETQLNTYDVIMKNNGKVCDVNSLACKIKVFERSRPGNLTNGLLHISIFYIVNKHYI